MARPGPTLLVLALLVATAVAFVLAERLKLERSPIVRPDITEVFSPACECPDRVARVAFTPREPARVTVAVIDADDRVVRTLVSRRRYGRDRVSLAWDGRDRAGRLVADGVYRLRLELGRRTIVPPNRIEVDTRPPEVEIARLSRPVFSPDGDGRFDSVTLDYSIDDRARAILYVGGRRYERKKLRGEGGTFRWSGRLGGRTLPAGMYTLAVVAEDDAGNRSRRATARVRIRYVELARSLVRARGGTRFGVRVRTDARRVVWRIGRRRGTAAPGLLVVRAPSRAGRYFLSVSANGHVDRARVLVTTRPRT